MWRRTPEGGHPVANMPLMSLVHVNYLQVVDPVQADGVGCRVIFVVLVVMNGKVHRAIGRGVDRGHHLVACQHGRQIGWGSLHPGLPSMTLFLMQQQSTAHLQPQLTTLDLQKSRFFSESLRLSETHLLDTTAPLVRTGVEI